MRRPFASTFGAVLITLSVSLIFREASGQNPTLAVWGFCGQIGGAHEITTKYLCASRRPGLTFEDDHTVGLMFYKTQWQDGLYVKSHGEEWKARLLNRGRSLEAEDLRIGHQVKVDHHRGEVEVLNYVTPAKLLRLALSIKPLEKPEGQTAAVLRTSLSWLLPADTSFTKASSSPSTAIGDLDVSFIVTEGSTQWTYRSRKRMEILKIHTKSLASGVLTTWDNVETAGGSEPGLTSSITDMAYSSPFNALPPFKVTE